MCGAIDQGMGLADGSLPNPSCTRGSRCNKWNLLRTFALTRPNFRLQIYSHSIFSPRPKNEQKTAIERSTEMCTDAKESHCVAGMFRSQFCSKIYWPYACNLESKTEGEIICTEECRSNSKRGPSGWPESSTLWHQWAPVPTVHYQWPSIV